MLKHTILVAAVAGLVLALAGTAQAALTGQLGILDEAWFAANPTNPDTAAPWQGGDTYHLVFVTLGTLNGISTDIGDYNAFVQGAADAAGIGATESVTWYAIGSTATVDAKDNAVVSAPVYNMLPELVATNASDMWDGDIAGPILYTENRVIPSYDSYPPARFAWTGSGPSGVANRPLGSGKPMIGGSNDADGQWIAVTWAAALQGQGFRLYGLSEALLVLPPTMVWRTDEINNWATENWTLDDGVNYIEPIVDYQMVVNSGLATVEAGTIAPQAFRLVIARDAEDGSVAIDGTLTATNKVMIGLGGDLSVDGALTTTAMENAGIVTVNGELTTDTLDSSGTTTLDGIAAIGEITVTDGETNFTVDSITTGLTKLTVSGGVANLDTGSTITGLTELTVSGGTANIDTTSVLSLPEINVSGAAIFGPATDVTTVDMNVSDGTATFDTTATISIEQLNASGGVTTFDPLNTATIGGLKVSGGTVTIDGHDVPTVVVSDAASVLNLSNSTATDITISNGSVTFGADVSTTTAAISSTSTVDATVPLAISSVLKLPGQITATYTPGGGATSFTVSGANLADSSEARTMTLSGGTLDLPGAPGYQEGLQGSLFRSAPRNNTFLNLEGSTYQTSETRIFTGDKADTVLALPSEVGYDIVVDGGIACANNNDWGPFPTLDSDWEDFVTAYSGRFFPSETGTYNFRANSDDRSWMWIDMDDNGVFDAGENVGNYEWYATGTKELDSTKGYNVVIMGQEFGGGRTVNWWVTKPSGGEAAIDTTDATGNGGQWMYGTGGTGATNMPNTTIVATANSTLMTDGATIALGGIETSNATTLTINGDATAINVTNMSLGGGSMVKSTAAAAGGEVTITLDGTLSGGDGGSSSVGHPDDLPVFGGVTNLMLGVDSIYEWTFGEAGVDEQYVHVYGILTLDDSLTIRLVDNGGSASNESVVLLKALQLVGDDTAITLAPLPDGWTSGALVIDELDGLLILENLVTVTGPLPGDANNNGVVDDADWVIFKAQFGGAPGGVNNDADFNNDGRVDLRDMAILKAAWDGGPGAPEMDATPTPEPATMSLLALGGLLVLRRRRRKA